MVQRKVPNKHGIQDDHVNAEKRLGNLKPTSCQHQDGKNRGPDLKKKMKRSKSIKLSDIESLKSSPLRKTIAQPGKSPPSRAPTAAAALQKQHIIKATDGSPPNYMKSTSSSEARKERSQVSSMTIRTGLDGKNLRRRNSNSSDAGSISSNRTTRALTRSSSLKLVRTLTKAPSFKPTTRKTPRVAICSDVNVQKATCSSTLKDSKFPPYLTLNPGGTEAEGTSVLKVCPYTYCSLNGHSHTPLPPLKCFLRVRRHSLKTQRNMKLGVSSPRKATNMSDDGLAKIDGGMPLDSFDFPTMEEVGMDFFVEIYANDKVDEAEATQKGTEKEDTGATEKVNELELLGSFSDASPHLMIDAEEHFEPYPDTGSAHMKITEFFLQQDSLSLPQEEVATGCFDHRTNIAMEHQTSTEEDDSSFEASDMEWEEGQTFAASEDDARVGHLDTSDEDVDAKIAYLSDIKRLDLVYEPEIIGAGEVISDFPDEIPADEVLQEHFEEETASASPCNNNVFQLDPELKKGRILECCHMTGALSSDQVSSAVAAFEEVQDVEEKNKEAQADLTDIKTSSAQVEDDETTIITGMPKDNLIHCQEDRSLQGDDATTLIQNKADEDYRKGQNFGATKTLAGSICVLDQEDGTEDHEQVDNVKSSTERKLLGSLLGFPDTNTDGAEVNDNKNCIITEVSHLDGAVEDIALPKDLHDGSGCIEPHDSQFDCQFMSINVTEDLNLLEEDQDAANRVNIPTPTDSEEKTGSKIYKVQKAEEDGRGNNSGDVKTTEEEVCNESDPAAKFLTDHNGTSQTSQYTSLQTGSNFNQEIPNTCNGRKWKFSSKKGINESDEERTFNPREPNFLDPVHDPEAEKVDLRHQNMDDRKNAEEWMLDFALQQAVTKLAPARKRKVALLVEAFETVLPIPKYESHIRHTSSGFSHARPIQACS